MWLGLVHGLVDGISAFVTWLTACHGKLYLIWLVETVSFKKAFKAILFYGGRRQKLKFGWEIEFREGVGRQNLSGSCAACNIKVSAPPLYVHGREVQTGWSRTILKFWRWHDIHSQILCYFRMMYFLLWWLHFIHFC